MSSRRKRKSERSLCSPRTIEVARERVNSGESKRGVAKSLGMAESTLRLRLSRPRVATSLGRYETTFPKEVEDEFCDHLKKMDNMFYGMTGKHVRQLAYEYAEINKIPHRFSHETKMAGKGWLRGLLTRHPELSFRRPTSTSIARAMGFNRPQCERFFINLTALMDRYNFPPNSIYNMDETGMSTVPNRPPKVISTKGKRSVNKISSAERGNNVTVVNAVNPAGHFIPPAFIYGRKRMKAELLDGAPTGSIGMVSDKSFITSDLYLQWLTHFKDHAKPTKDNPVLLILDNHSSHLSLAAIDFCRNNNIIALTLPPHSSHKMQPLDRGFHTVLKQYYSNECEKWMRSHPGRTITVFQVASIFGRAFMRAATPAQAAESFKTTGIWPYDPDVFTDVDFMASSVSERDNEAQEMRTEKEISRAHETQQRRAVQEMARTDITQKIATEKETVRTDGTQEMCTDDIIIIEVDNNDTETERTGGDNIKNNDKKKNTEGENVNEISTEENTEKENIFKNIHKHNKTGGDNNNNDTDSDNKTDGKAVDTNMEEKTEGENIQDTDKDNKTEQDNIYKENKKKTDGEAVDISEALQLLREQTVTPSETSLAEDSVVSRCKNTLDVKPGCSKDPVYMNIYPTVIPSGTSAAEAPVTSPGFLKFDAIAPFPKSEVKRSFTRKHKKSEIITSSPFKSELEKHIEEKNNVKVKKIKIEGKKNEEKGKPQIKTKAKAPKHKRLESLGSSPFESEHEKQMEEENKPEVKKIKIEGSKNEEKGKPQIKAKAKVPNSKKIKSKQNKTCKCIGCEESYEEPITEDWIQCSACSGWWHEKCTGYHGFGTFICDLC